MGLGGKEDEGGDATPAMPTQRPWLRADAPELFPRDQCVESRSRQLDACTQTLNSAHDFCERCFQPLEPERYSGARINPHFTLRKHR